MRPWNISISILCVLLIMLFSLQDCSLFYSKNFCFPCVKKNLKAFPLEIQEDMDKRKPQQKSWKKKPNHPNGYKALILKDQERHFFGWGFSSLCLETIMLLLLKKWPSSAHRCWREQHISLPLAWVQTSPCSAREWPRGAEEPGGKADQPAVTMWNAAARNQTAQTIGTMASFSHLLF